MHRHFIFTCLSAILALGIVACGSSGGGGAAAGSGGGGTTTDVYTWSQTAGQPLVTVPALPSATVATTAKMRINCLSKALISAQVRLLVTVDGVAHVDKPVTMTLLTAKSTVEPYNVYEYIVNENLGTIPAGTGRSISVTIDADNTYTAPGPFNIKVFTLVVAVSPSFAG